MPEHHPPQPHPRVRVALSTLSAGMISHHMFSAWTNLLRYDTIGTDGTDGCQHVLAGGTIELMSGPRVAEGRSQVVDAFLRTPSFKGVEWLMMIDSDMTFEPDALCQLLCHAYGGEFETDPYEPDCHIIGGLCFAGGRSRMYPTIYRSEVHSTTGQVVPEPIETYPRNTLVKAAATGAAFLLVHRKVLVHMAQEWPDGFGTDMHGQKNPHPWFVEGQNAGVQFGEDVAFCLRAGALGYPTYVHTGVGTGHVKTLELNEEVWDDYLARIAREKAERTERTALYGQKIDQAAELWGGEALRLPDSPKVGSQ